jgi:hypothetical protein
MSEQVISPVKSPLLSPVQRVVNIFVSPSKTFGDIRRSSGWWFPYLLAAVVGLIYAFVVLHRIGVPALVDAAIHQSAKMQDQMANATPEQAARIRSITAISFNALYAGPVFSIVIGLIVGGILLAGGQLRRRWQGDLRADAGSLVLRLSTSAGIFPADDRRDLCGIGGR